MLHNTGYDIKDVNIVVLMGYSNGFSLDYYSQIFLCAEAAVGFDGNVLLNQSFIPCKKLLRSLITVVCTPVMKYLGRLITVETYRW